MEKDIFWEVFRDTGDPLCWLLTRYTRPEPQKDHVPDRREERPSVPA